jgi:hypothetical protein
MRLASIFAVFYKSHTMRSQARLLALAAALLLAPLALRAADPGMPGPFALLPLKDGRLLHNVKIISNQPDSIVVKADEGLLKLAKANLPQGVASAIPAKAAPAPRPVYVTQPFNPDKQLGASPGAVNKLENASTYKGCSIVSFQSKAFQNSLGCAEVVIRNDSDTPADIFPGNLVCITTSGARHIGRNLIINGDTPVVKRVETIPGRGEIDELVTFTNDALDISYVQWNR